MLSVTFATALQSGPENKYWIFLNSIFNLYHFSKSSRTNESLTGNETLLKKLVQDTYISIYQR